jgi:hypothetical protein
MAARYGAFLVRCWWLPDGRQRVEIEHVQSGERARVASLAAAAEWIGAQAVPGAGLTRASPDRVAEAGTAPGTGRVPAGE